MAPAAVPAVSVATTRIMLTMEPVTYCPMDFVIPCRATRRAMKMAVVVIQRIFDVLFCIEKPPIFCIGRDSIIQILL